MTNDEQQGEHFTVEIKHADYLVAFDPATATVICAGNFRLQGGEYAPIETMLAEAADAKSPLITLDVRDLQFLNSSGINTISKFVLRVRKHNASRVIIRGNNQYPWQKKSLANLERLLPGLQLEFA
jgi:hypothetical protein